MAVPMDWGKPLVSITALTTNWSHEELFVFAFHEIFATPIGNFMTEDRIKFVLFSPGQRTVLQPDIDV